MEPFVRGVNLGLTRFSPPIRSDVTPSRQAFVAELGFELLRVSVEAGTSAPDRRATAHAVSRTRTRIAAVSSYPEEMIELPSDAELREARQILTNMRQFLFTRRGTKLHVNPWVPGCGLVDRCAVDLLVRRPGAWWRWSPIARRPVIQDHEEQLLFEVKAVQRPFRAQDFRQLLMYSALMLADGIPPDFVGLVNPRRGLYFECALDELTMDVCGTPADEVLQQILFDITSEASM